MALYTNMRSQFGEREAGYENCVYKADKRKALIASTILFVATNKVPAKLMVLCRIFVLMSEI